MRANAPTTPSKLLSHSPTSTLYLLCALFRQRIRKHENLLLRSDNARTRQLRVRERKVKSLRRRTRCDESDEQAAQDYRQAKAEMRIFYVSVHHYLPTPHSKVHYTLPTPW